MRQFLNFVQHHISYSKQMFILLKAIFIRYTAFPFAYVLDLFIAQQIFLWIYSSLFYNFELLIIVI